jgi:hypothetical protein
MPRRPAWPDAPCPGGPTAREVLRAIHRAARESNDPGSAAVAEAASHLLDPRALGRRDPREGCARLEAAAAAVRLDPAPWDLALSLLAPPAPAKRAAKPARPSAAKGRAKPRARAGTATRKPARRL